MGFPIQLIEDHQQDQKQDQNQNKNQPKDYQKYYSDLFDQITEANQMNTVSVKQIVSSIFSRTKLPTKTHQNRQLALLDIDKIISLNMHLINQKGEQIKYMRMVAGLKHQNQRPNANLQSPNRQIQNLVRLARLHFMSNERRNDRESDDEQNINRQGTTN